MWAFSPLHSRCSVSYASDRWLRAREYSYERPSLLSTRAIRAGATILLARAKGRTNENPRSTLRGCIYFRIAPSSTKITSVGPYATPSVLLSRPPILVKLPHLTLLARNHPVSMTRQTTSPSILNLYLAVGLGIPRYTQDTRRIFRLGAWFGTVR